MRGIGLPSRVWGRAGDARGRGGGAGRGQHSPRAHARSQRRSRLAARQPSAGEPAPAQDWWGRRRVRAVVG